MPWMGFVKSINIMSNVQKEPEMARQSGYPVKYISGQFHGRKIGGILETLLECLQITWDGDLISKTDRDELVNKGLIVRSNGYNIISAKGIEYLEQLGIIHC
jgi:hypothetical protein